MSMEYEERLMRRMLAAADWDRLTNQIGAILHQQEKSIQLVTYGDPDMKEASRIRKAAK